VAVNIIAAPTRQDKLSDIDGTASLRVIRFFEEVSRVIESFTMDNITAVTQADAGAVSASYVQAEVQAIADLANANKAKINELITAMQTFNLMEV
jgi:hypothetical protein